MAERDWAKEGSLTCKCGLQTFRARQLRYHQRHGCKKPTLPCAWRDRGEHLHYTQEAKAVCENGGKAAAPRPLPVVSAA